MRRFFSSGGKLTQRVGGLAGIALLRVLGCGGISQAPPAGVSRAELAVEADAACQRDGRSIDALPIVLRKGSSAVADFLDQANERDRRLYDELKHLRPTASLKGQVDAYLATFAQWVRDARRAASRAHRGDVGAVATLLAAWTGPDDRLAPQARRLGWAHCAD